MLGDIHIAEPGALICFAGPRVIQQTIREQLPEGFQRAEYLLAHGMIDMVVHRHKMRETLSRICRLLMGAPVLKHDRSTAARRSTAVRLRQRQRGRCEPDRRCATARRRRSRPRSLAPRSASTTARTSSATRLATTTIRRRRARSKTDSTDARDIHRVTRAVLDRRVRSSQPAGAIRA